MRGIVISTSEVTKEYLPELLASLAEIEYPIVVVWNRFELGAIQKGKETFDEFVYLMDSCVIKDPSFIEKLFQTEGNVFLTENGFHYMGKFVSGSLPEIPKVQSKEEAIDQELKWLKAPGFIPNLPAHTDIFEEKFGQNRMRLENDFIIKWKGTYRV